MSKVLPKSFNFTTTASKVGSLSSITNANLKYQYPQNKNGMDIPDEKMQVNHVRVPTSLENKEKCMALKLEKYTLKAKETFLTIRGLKKNKEIDNNDHESYKPELILNNNVISDKEEPKLPVKIGTITSLETNMDVCNSKKITIPVK